MQPFRFSLEKVHRYRLAIEKQQKRQLAVARQRQAEEEILLRQYLEERENFQEKAARGPGEARLGELWERDLYLQMLDSRVELQEEKVEQAVTAVKEQQDLVRQAIKERKILDSLKRRQQASYTHMAAREEQKHLDEVAVLSYNRRQEEL